MANETDITPALTADEWRDALAGRRPDLYRGDDDTPEASHASAALQLHGQPFGFTWDDVDALESAVGVYLSEYNEVEPALKTLADRIAALLPPRQTAS